MANEKILEDKVQGLRTALAANGRDTALNVQLQNTGTGFPAEISYAGGSSQHR